MSYFCSHAYAGLAFCSPVGLWNLDHSEMNAEHSRIRVRRTEDGIVPVSSFGHPEAVQPCCRQTEHVK